MQLMLDAVAETAEVARFWQLFWPLFWPLCLRNRIVPLADSAGGGASNDEVVWSYATCSLGRTPASCLAAVTTLCSATRCSSASSPEAGTYFR